jgi:hypothetical protein
MCSLFWAARVAALKRARERVIARNVWVVEKRTLSIVSRAFGKMSKSPFNRAMSTICDSSATELRYFHLATRLRVGSVAPERLLNPGPNT